MAVLAMPEAETSDVNVCRLKATTMESSTNIDLNLGTHGQSVFLKIIRRQRVNMERRQKTENTCAI